MLPEDQVLLKNTKTSVKLSTNFEQTPYTIEMKEGQELTVRAPDGGENRRNSSFMKPYTSVKEPTSTINQGFTVLDFAETGDLRHNAPRKSPSMSTWNTPMSPSFDTHRRGQNVW